MFRININVVPKSSQKKILQSSEGLKVYLHEAPEGGKANKVLIKMLAEYYNVKKKAIKIIAGNTNRNKIIEISN